MTGYFREHSCWDATIKKNMALRNVDPTMLEAKYLLKLGREIFLVANGSKHAITSPDAFERHGFDWAHVRDIQHLDGFHALPKGPDVV